MVTVDVEELDRRAEGAVRLLLHRKHRLERTIRDLESLMKAEEESRKVITNLRKRLRAATSDSEREGAINALTIALGSVSQLTPTDVQIKRSPQRSAGSSRDQASSPRKRGRPAKPVAPVASPVPKRKKVSVHPVISSLLTKALDSKTVPSLEKAIEALGKGAETTVNVPSGNKTIAVVPIGEEVRREGSQTLRSVWVAIDKARKYNEGGYDPAKYEVSPQLVGLAAKLAATSPSRVNTMLKRWGVSASS